MVALIDGMFVALSQPSGWIWSFAALIATWALAVLLWRSSSTRAPSAPCWAVPTRGRGRAPPPRQQAPHAQRRRLLLWQHGQRDQRGVGVASGIGRNSARRKGFPRRRCPGASRDQGRDHEER